MAHIRVMPRAAKKPKPHKLTDAERHERFKDMAHEVGAEGDAPSFDRTVERLARLPRQADGKEA